MGLTALHWAVKKDFKLMVKLLLEFNASANQQDNFGRTPLFIAANSGNIQLVRILIENRALPGIKSMAGNSSLDVCKVKLYDLKQEAAKLTELHKSNVAELVSLQGKNMDSNDLRLNISYLLKKSIEVKFEQSKFELILKMLDKA